MADTNANTQDQDTEAGKNIPAPDDEFDSAFAESDDEGLGVKAGQAASDDTGTDPDKNADTGAAASQADAGDKSQSGTGTDADAGDKGKTADSDDALTKLQRQNEELEQHMKSWGGRLSASDRRNRELEAELERLRQGNAKTGSDEKGKGTDADQDALDLENDPELKKALDEFPDAVGPLVKQMSALKKQLSELGKNSTSGADAVKPVADKVDRLVMQEHIRIIGSKHEDWRDIVIPKDDKPSELDQWIASKPSYLRPGLEAVRDTGTAEQVIEMLDDLKHDREASTAAAEDARKKKAAEDKRQKQLEAAGAVPSRGAAKPAANAQGKDPNDFEAGWNEAPD